MKKFKRAIAAVLSTIVIVGSVATTAFVANESSETADTTPQLETLATEVELVTDVEAETETQSATESVTVKSPIIDKTHEVTFTVMAQDSEYNPIEGVGFVLYYVSADLNSAYDVKDVDKSKCEKTEMPLTDTSGAASVTFSGEKQGVYLVSCETIPSTVKTASDDFIITLPYTMDGETWSYTLEAAPKLVLAEATQPASAVTSGDGNKLDTSGSGNGLGTSGSKATVNTGDVFSSLCLLVALIFLSAGVVFLAKSKRLKNKTK